MKSTVYLVGAGPGDPGLLTVRGAELLRRADVVVYDYLSNCELLKLCPPTAERIYVGKSAGAHTRTQDEINGLLVEKAKAGVGRVIVRLKGGDPYVFGRGGEEGEFLRGQGVDFEVVPGVTAGIAAAAYAGIPVTHRDFASTVTFVTGHEKEGGEEDRVDYGALARLGGTLVFYMGVRSLGAIAERLVVAGMDAGMPAAVVRWGTHAKQRTVVGTLGTIAEEVKRAGITAPAVTIVGRVVLLRETLNWFERRPLFGKRILVTRARVQASELAAKLGGLGAEVIEVPTIEVGRPGEEEWEGIDRQLMQLPAFDWVVFTSANGVRAAWERLAHLGFDARHFGASHVAAVGRATAGALGEFGIVPDVVPARFGGESLAAAIRGFVGEEEIRGKRFLLLRADIGRGELREELLKLGGIAEDVAIYRTVRPAGLGEEAVAAIGEGADWITFTSASTAENLWEMLTPALRKKVGGMRRVSIGPMTTAALGGLGEGMWRATSEAGSAGVEGVVGAILGEGVE